MNSKERVLKTIEHQQPDRVPIGEWGIDHDHVSRIIGRKTYWRNRKDTTLALWAGKRDEVVEGLKLDYAELIETLDYDVVPVELVPPKGFTLSEDPPQQIDPETWRDTEGRIYKYCAANDSIMCITHEPARETTTEQELKQFSKNLLDIDDSQFELIDFIAEKFADTRALVFRGLSPYGPLMGQFGSDQAHQLMMTIIAPDEIKKRHDVTVQYNRLLMERCAGKGVLIAMMGHDYGTSTGCIMSPKTIRELFMPVKKRIAQDARQLGMIPFFHCCGRIWDILEDWIEAGFVGYQSIQGSAGMDMAVIKEKYGDKLALWTGVQCETLVAGTPEQVEREVIKSLEICMPKGGFIFGSTNSVQFGAKTENYLKALEIVRKYGRYK